MKKILIAILLVSMLAGAIMPASAGSVVGSANTGVIQASPSAALGLAAVCSNSGVATDALAGLATIQGTQICG